MAMRNAVVPTSPPDLNGEFINMVAPHFKVGDFAVTLTFPENWKPDPMQRTSDVRNYLRRVNAGLLGAGRCKRGEYLKCAHVFETSACGTTIHLHMILENPAEGKVAEEERMSFLLDSWMAMRCSGVRSANDVQVIDNVEKWTGYMFKRINQRTAHMADVENWKL